MTSRRVIAVKCRVMSTVWVDVPAHLEVEEVCDWVEDGDYDADAPIREVSYSGESLAGGHVINLLSLGYPIVVMDNDRRHVNVVSSWDDLRAARQRIDPDPKAPTVGQRDIFGGEVAE